MKDKLIQFIISSYNDIFKEVNKKVLTKEVWYNEYFGDTGTYLILFEDGIFKVSLSVNHKEKIIEIPFEEMIERIYLYSRYELEDFMLSLNYDNICGLMKESNQVDGYYLIINDSNRTKLQKSINKNFQKEFEWSMKWHNDTIEKNKTLPDKPEMEFRDDEDLLESFDRYKALDDNLYKRKIYGKPILEVADLNDFIILETFT